MPSLPALFAPLALLLPLGAVGTERPVQSPQTAHEGPEVQALPLSGVQFDWTSIIEPLGDASANQVRIERRVILRISPQPMPTQRNLMAELPNRPMTSRIEERPAGKCLPVNGIAGVQPDRGGRLMLYMRDRRVIAADLEKSCSARDYYSGFYLEPSDDGKLCIGRDHLKSRSGTMCQVSRLRQLVSVED